MNKNILFFLPAIMTLLLCSSPQKNGTGNRAVTPDRKSAAVIQYDLPTYYITTCDPNARMGSLSLTLIYSDNDDLTGAIKMKIGEINDAIDRRLKGKRYDDIDSGEDRQKLIGEIEKEVNDILLTDGLVSVRLEDMLVE